MPFVLKSKYKELKKELDKTVNIYQLKVQNLEKEISKTNQTINKLQNENKRLQKRTENPEI